MKAFSRIVALAALVCVPSVAFADFHKHRSNDDSCSPRESTWYPRPRDHNYNNSNYNYGYSNPRPNYGGNYYGTSSTSYNSSNYDNAIRNGVRSGQLSPSEVRDLREDLNDIHRQEIRYGSDGYLTPRERDALQGEMNDFRKDLNHELRDGERRW